MKGAVISYVNFNDYTTTQNGQFAIGQYEDQTFKFDSNFNMIPPPPNEETFAGFTYEDNTGGNFSFQSKGSDGEVDVYFLSNGVKVPYMTLYQTGFQTNNLVSFKDVNGYSYVLGTSKPVASFEHPAILYNDGSAGSFASNSVVCFASGSLIETSKGDIAVEALRVGDLAITASGAARAIRWIGHRTIDCRGHADPRAVWPIRVAAHAFGDDLPAADLFLSAGHSVKLGLMGDVLIPIGRLINGATIARHPVDEVTYWHVELDSHDVLIANGLPAESFLDCGNRFGLVEQEGDYDRLACPHTPADFCLPLLEDGEVLEAVRSLLAARAARLGWKLTHDMDMHLMVDDVRIEPDIDGSVARFFFPALAQSVVLASLTRTPGDAEPIADYRRLGLSLHRLEFSDGLCLHRDVIAADPRLDGLVHPESDTSLHHRFTDGHLTLPSSLWAGCSSQVMLRVYHDPHGGSRWLAPTPDAAIVVPLRYLG